MLLHHGRTKRPLIAVPTMGPALACNNATRGRDQYRDISAFSLPRILFLLFLAPGSQRSFIGFDEAFQVKGWGRHLDGPDIHRNSPVAAAFADRVSEFPDRNATIPCSRG